MSSASAVGTAGGSVRWWSQEAIMTRQADLKRRVRARMARTGESYAPPAPTWSPGGRDWTATGWPGRCT
jgi:hypothetical protein